MHEKCEQLKTDTNVQVGSETDDQLFFKACGGWSDKRTINGLRREGSTMFERPTNVRRGSSSTSSAYTSLVVTKLHSQLQSTRTELQTTQSELQTTRAQLQATKEELETTKEELEATTK